MILVGSGGRVVSGRRRAVGIAVASGALAGIRGRRWAAIGATAVAVALAVPEICVVHVDLPARAIVAVPILPLAGLEAARDNHHPALGEILADELAGVPPRNAVNEIGLLLLALSGIVPIAGQGERRHRHIALRVAQFRVLREPAHEGDVVQQTLPPGSYR